MNGDTRDIKEAKSSNILSVVGGLSFVAAGALSYFAVMNYVQNITVSKSSFVCTKIEQIGKNMDDVRCVQYTHQKFSQDAVTLNMMVK